MPRHYQTIEKCRICGNNHLVSVLNLGNQYLTGVFPKKKDESLTCAPLELVKCVSSKGEEACGLVQMKHSFNLKELYGKSYGYRSGLNQSMIDHLSKIVEKIRRLVTLNKGDLIIDIGSNDGTLLKEYPDAGLELYGIDPTAGKFSEFYPENVTLITDFFPSPRMDTAIKGKKAKVVTSIAMFYDLEEPLKFVREVYNILEPEGIWVFEQSYLPSMLKTVSYDTICHEHLEYYALKQIKWLTDRVGFIIVDIEINEINGGSFSVTVAKKDSKSYQENTALINEITALEVCEKCNELPTWEEFSKGVSAHRSQLVRLLSDLKKANAKVIGYGASTKGNVILQYCGITPALLPFIAEVNEDKFGAYTPGTHIPIISEKEAKAMKPDYFLVLPWHFREGIIKKEQDFLNAGGKFIFPLPRIEIA